MTTVYVLLFSMCLLLSYFFFYLVWTQNHNENKGQNKKYWITKEDKTLIDALVKLYIWWVENRFRSGYLFS